MGILGVQIVFSLIAFSFLQKLSRYYSFGLWLLSGRLVRYLHPTNEQLKSLAGINNNKRSRRNDQPRSPDDASFTVSRNIPLELDTAPMQDIDLIMLKFYPDYQWLMDYSACATCVYVLTELALYLGWIKVDYNLSVMWCLLAAGFCIRLLLAQLVMYMKTEGGERILCFAFALFFIIVAMAILLVDQQYLEFGLEEGYSNFSENAKVFMIKSGYLNHGPVSIKTFKIILAIICTILGTFLTFPGLRFAKMYLDSLLYAKEMPLKQTILHVNFILPLVYVLLWVKPIGRDLLCVQHSPYQKRALLQHDTFDAMRIALGLAMCFVRLTLLTTHLQSYLNLAYQKVQRMRRESGKISSIELQKMVARVSCYVCVVTTQYVCPMLLTFFALLLLKTLGGYSWARMFAIDLGYSPAGDVAPTAPTLDSETPSILDTADHLSATFGNLRRLFAPVWYRGLLSFLTWWINATWFASSLFGVVYYSRFTD